MKTHQILYRHFGENSDTAKTPVAVFSEGMSYQGQPVELGEQIYCCLNWDDNRLVPTRKWAVLPVRLPDWLGPEAWLRRPTDWSWAWGLGMDPSWPEAWQRSIVAGRFSEAQRLAMIKLLKTRHFRSDFRRSLAEQLVCWLETEPEARAYASPFSPKQWAALIDRWVAREAEQLSSGLYYGHRYHELAGV